MSPTRRASLSRLMTMAWDFRRSEPGRAFADCLRAAWKLTKGLAKEAARFRAKAAGGHVRLSPSLISSPIRRATAGQRYGRARDFQAAYITARVGY